ncbi:tetraacyldisaccharide 4'-kinase [Spongiibacter nanhainus]|uniref:Tetraacyldisaccharide 4'-kinase n=1 Tax=Spongiibacter nanhainus TaxID=2794344 RepID=A0A7T4QXZ8_9GAMM|nr:tetraacyldisaccharide 4'-kinase [Spongiibacter nanhainus]QQD16712.1 tetraacyldisaccharide 4'-kinase [Spongiibacter nanhainus]
MSLESWLTERWYGRPGLLYGLLPLEGLFRCLSALRRTRQQPQHSGVPVIVVGNIAVGGAGKTPLVIALVEHFKALGWHPGVVSRGYGAQPPHRPFLVTGASTPQQAGDEPCLIAQRCGVPVAVDPDRPAAAQCLVEQGCDLLISDDGMQHYRLNRQIEVAVIDGRRGLGNGHCLPVGPLREPPSRLSSVDILVSNGELQAPLAVNALTMNLLGGEAIHLASKQRRTLAGWPQDQRRVHALAGIGNPQRFFDSLNQAGLAVEAHPFADHHDYSVEDLSGLGDKPLLITEKDAVKLRPLLASRKDIDAWVVPVSAGLPKEFYQQVEARLGASTSGAKP